MSDNDEDIKVPLKLRLKAWWEGYDLDDVKKRLKGLHDHETPVTSESNAEPESEISILPWDKIRMDMAQLVWGEGYCGPGGSKHIENMSKLLGMNSEMSAIVIGAGFGGPSRVLTEEFGVWITGYELSPKLAEKAMQMSTDAGLASKAAIHHLDPEQDHPFDRQYDRGFSKEALYCFPDKNKILKDTFDALKDGALFLITDYTLSGLTVLKNPDVQKWLKQEPVRPYPVTAAMMKTALTDVGFGIRVNEDISAEYVKLIEDSWSRATAIAKQLATKGEQGIKAIESLMIEAEYWALRAKILKEGHIHVWRFLAHKPKAELR